MAQLPEKLEKARVQIIFREPFYGPMLYGYPCEETEAVDAMATDGRVIKYNREWVEGQSIDNLKGVLIHELDHIIYLHHIRFTQLSKQFKDDPEKKAMMHRKANMAADYVINPMVLDDGFTLPDDALNDSQWRGMSMEQVFHKLPDPPKNGGGGQGNGPAWGGVESMGDDMTEEELKEAADKTETQVRQAAMTAKARGTVPAHVKQLLSDLDEAKVDWRTRLWKACDHHGTAYEDITWDRPNRRYAPLGAYIPSREEFGPGTVVCAIDTSGSVSDAEANAFMSEIKGIMEDTLPERVLVIQCDAQINDIKDYDPSCDIMPNEVEIHGRGGTSFSPPFDWVEKEGIRPQYFIYLTDGCAPFPEQPDYPVIWVMSTDEVAPWGDNIRINVE